MVGCGQRVVVGCTGFTLCLKDPTVSTSGGKATHGPIAPPITKDFGAGCISDVFLLSGTLKMVLSSEKTVCFDFQFLRETQVLNQY